MTEALIHRAIVQYLRAVLPSAVVHHAANEVRRAGRAGHVNRAMNAGMGVVPGYPDLVVHLPANLGTVFLEIKAEGGRTSPAQKALHEQLETLGYRVAVVRSVEDVRETLAGWGVWIGNRDAEK